MPQVYQPANPDPKEQEQELIHSGMRPDQGGALAGAPNGVGNSSVVSGAVAGAAVPVGQAMADATYPSVTGAVTGATIAENPMPQNNGNTGGGAPSGGGGYGGGGGSTAPTTPATPQAGASGKPAMDYTEYLLQEYNNLNNYQQAQTDLVNNTTQELINLTNSQIDIQVANQIADLTSQLDQAKGQYAQIRAKLEQAKATEADNLALMAAANGDRGGVAKAQYSAQMQQRDQALYEIDLAQVNLEQQLQQAIAEAKRTGDYQKLTQQIQYTQAAYEQLYNLASQVMQTKTQDAAQLDNYYLQIQEIQQNAVLNKINAGITVTPEDMEIFGLTGEYATQAAEQINSSMGVQRQMLVEELNSMRRQNSASYGGYSGGSGGSGGGGGASYSGNYGFSYDQTVPSAVMQVIEATLEGNGGLSYWLPNGQGGTVWASSQGGLTSQLPVGATVNAGDYGNFVWNGSKWMSQDAYTNAGSTGNTAATASGSASSASQAQRDYYNQLAWERYVELYNKYNGKFIEDNGGVFDPTAYIGRDDPYYYYIQMANA